MQTHLSAVVHCWLLGCCRVVRLPDVVSQITPNSQHITGELTQGRVILARKFINTTVTTLTVETNTETMLIDSD